MSSVSVCKGLLTFLNSVLIFLAIAIVTTSIWFFVEVKMVADLRNYNHYVLDYTVYWPQAIPWLFLVICVFVIVMATIGILAAKRESRGLTMTYLIFGGIVIVALITAAAVALALADGKRSDDFIKDTIWDAFQQSRANPEVKSGFQKIERRMLCCGADSPRDYRTGGASDDEFPQSCCDNYYNSYAYSLSYINTNPYNVCEFSNKQANERYGCAKVLSQYARIVIRILAGCSVFTTIMAIISVVVASSFRRALKHQRQRGHSSTSTIAKHEVESTKVLL